MNMTTDQLLEALKPYGVDLQYSPVSNTWQVILLDWDWYHCERADPRAALQLAWDTVQREKVQT